MDKRELKSILEAVLFVWSEPIHIDEIMAILDLDKKSTRQILKEMQDENDHYRRGIIINEHNDYFQLSTRKEHFDYLKKLVKNSKRRISNSSMEVLAIIAYNQPITRIEIDNIRGVKSYSSIDTLRNKGLIEEVGKSDAVGKPIQYGTTIEFLKAFDLKNIDELPIIEELEKLNQVLDDEDED